MHQKCYDLDKCSRKCMKIPQTFRVDLHNPYTLTVVFNPYTFLTYVLEIRFTRFIACNYTIKVVNYLNRCLFFLSVKKQTKRQLDLYSNQVHLLWWNQEIGEYHFSFFPRMTHGAKRRKWNSTFVLSSLLSSRLIISLVMFTNEDMKAPVA